MDSKVWAAMYRQVAEELGMPPRGKKGSPENMERKRLAPKVFQETLRRFNASVRKTEP